MTVTDVIQQDHPTIDAPAHGVVNLFVNGREMMLASAEWWIDGDEAVVRSREFDCFATGATLQDALENFSREVYSYADRLQRLEDSREATETERETLRILAGRLSRIYLEERRSQQKRRFWLRKRDGHDRRIRPVVA